MFNKRSMVVFLAFMLFISCLCIIPRARADPYFSFFDDFESTNEYTMSPWSGYYESGGSVNITDLYPLSGTQNFMSYLSASQTTSWGVVYKNTTGYNYISITIENVYFLYPPSAGKNQFVMACTNNTHSLGVAYAGIQNKTADNKLYWVVYYYDQGILKYAYGDEVANLHVSSMQLIVYGRITYGHVTLRVDSAIQVVRTGLQNAGRKTNYALIGYSYSGSGSHASEFYCDDALVEGYYITPPPYPVNNFIGFSSYPESISGVAEVCDLIDYVGLNIYRMSFSPSWVAQVHPYNTDYIDYFLANSDATLIIDRNHLYPPNQASADHFNVHFNDAIADLLEICSDYGNNSRVYIELVNEYVDANWTARNQQMLSAIRGAGWNNALVANKWTLGWGVTVLTDPLDKVYYGMHFYFNTWSVAGAMAQMNYAIGLGLKVINTEIGANYNEEGTFTQGEVDELIDFMHQCRDLGIGNCIWLKYDIGNWDTYAFFGIDVPVDYSDVAWVTVLAPFGGAMNLTTGLHAYEKGTIIAVQATAFSGYRFKYFSEDYHKTIMNPLVIMLTGNVTLQAMFVSTAGTNITGSLMSFLPYMLFIAGAGIAIILVRGRRE